MKNMGNHIKTEQINVKEYMKSKLKAAVKAFAETFSTLGDIIGGTSNVSKLNDAEIEVEEIWASNKKSRDNIKALESRMENSTRERKKTKGNTAIGETDKKQSKGNTAIGETDKKQSKELVRKETRKKEDKDEKSKGHEIGD